MSETLTFGLLCFTSFFTLINPLGVMPVFMTMTSSLDTKARNKTARKATIIAFLTLIMFAFLGQVLFEFFNISVNSFRVVGGIIYFIVGLDMLQARIGKINVAKDEIHKYVEDISITPLAIPMICGPGAITNAIILMEDAQTIDYKIALFSAVFVVGVLTFLILFGASKIINVLGDTGNKVMMRLMGLIVMVIAVEFFFTGLTPIVREMIHP